MSELKVELKEYTVKLTADQELIDDLKNAPNRAKQEAIFAEAFDGWELIDPRQIGALTDAPIFAQTKDISYDEEGNITDVGRVCWYSNYQFMDWIEDIITTGTTTFPLA